LRFDSPPLWTALARGRPEGEPLTTLRAEWADDLQIIQTYASERVPKIALYGALAVLIFVVISLLRAPAARWAEQDEEFVLSARILDPPDVGAPPGQGFRGTAAGGARVVASRPGPRARDAPRTIRAGAVVRRVVGP
jgi:hypothetical protein